MAAAVPSVKAGDVIGFSDPGPLGMAINLATWGVPGWGLSHIAILAQHPDYSRPLLVESTTLAESPCLLTHRRTRGVQAHHWSVRLAESKGRVWHYPLCHWYWLSRHFSREFGSDPGSAGCRLTAYLCRQIDAGVTYDALGAFRSRSTPLGILERWLYPENLASLFCSEMVAAALREAGVWQPRNASRWSPNRLARTLVRLGICERPRRIK